jgi:hypothetical protein
MNGTPQQSRMGRRTRPCRTPAPGARRKIASSSSMAMVPDHGARRRDHRLALSPVEIGATKAVAAGQPLQSKEKMGPLAVGVTEPTGLVFYDGAATCIGGRADRDRLGLCKHLHRRDRFCKPSGQAFLVLRHAAGLRGIGRRFGTLLAEADGDRCGGTFIQTRPRARKGCLPRRQSADPILFCNKINSYNISSTNSRRITSKSIRVWAARRQHKLLYRIKSAQVGQIRGFRNAKRDQLLDGDLALKRSGRPSPALLLSRASRSSPSMSRSRPARVPMPSTAGPSWPQNWRRPARQRPRACSQALPLVSRRGVYLWPHVSAGALHRC